MIKKIKLVIAHWKSFDQYIMRAKLYSLGAWLQCLTGLHRYTNVDDCLNNRCSLCGKPFRGYVKNESIDE
jgi:hypothetical protein